MRGIVRIAKNRDENHVILLNENKSFVEQNYHGFHELTHILTVDEPGTTLNCFGILDLIKIVILNGLQMRVQLNFLCHTKKYFR